MAFTSTIQTSQYGRLPQDDFAIVKKLKDPNDPKVAAIETIIDTAHDPHPSIEMKSGAGLLNSQEIEKAFEHPKMLEFVGELKGKNRIPPKRKTDALSQTGGNKMKRTKIGAGLRFV